MGIYWWLLRHGSGFSRASDEDDGHVSHWCMFPLVPVVLSISTINPNTKKNGVL